MTKRIIYYDFIWTFLVFFFTSINLFACSYAYQYSLFPMGISEGDFEKQLLLLEVEMERYVNTPENQWMGSDNFGQDLEIETRWKGHLRLKVLRADSLHLLEDLGFVDISDDHYEASLQPYFKRAMRRASQQPNFTPAQVPELGICNYDNTCTFFEREIDTVNTQFYCYLPDSTYQNNKCAIAFPEVILKKFENMTKLKFSDIETVEAKSRTDYFRIWKPYAVRKYQIGEELIVLYTLGWGQKRYYTKKKEPTMSFPDVGSVEDFVEGKEVLMHGQRFDTLHWISK